VVASVFVISAFIGGGARAQEGTVCADMRALDPETRDMCKAAVLLCTIGPAGTGTQMRGGDARSAIRNCITDAINKAQTQAKSQSGMARCQDDADARPDAGIISCTAVIKSSAQSPHDLALGFAYRAIAYADKGMDSGNAALYGRALEDANQAIKIDPKVAQGFLAHGLALFAEGASSSDRKLMTLAVEDFSKAIQLNPNPSILASAFEFRGHAFRALGQNDRAVQDYSEAIKLDQKNARALYGRGEIERQTGNLTAAEADIRAARSIDPNVGN